MFDVLRDSIETPEIPLERESLAALLALRDRLDAKTSSAVGAYAAAGLHEVDGSKTMPPGCAPKPATTPPPP